MFQRPKSKTLVLFLGLMTGGSLMAEAKEKGGAEYVITGGQEGVIRKMLTAPQELMKAHDCGVKNIKVRHTLISNVFRCGQTTPKPREFPVVLRHRTAPDEPGLRIHRTEKFTVFLSFHMEIRLAQGLIEQIRRHEGSFKWLKKRGTGRGKPKP